MDVATTKRAGAAHVDRRERDLSPEQNERLRGFVEELRKRFSSQGELGRAIGLKQTTVSAFLIGKQGTSHAVAARVARLLGRSMADVLGDAPGATAGGEPIVDHLPNRARLRATDVWADLPEAVQRELMSLDFKRTGDKPYSWWLGEAARRLELYESGAIDPSLEDADPDGKR